MADPAVARRLSRPRRSAWGWKNLVIVMALVALSGLIGSAFYLRKTQAIAERDAILVTDFVNMAGDPVFDGSLKRALAVELEQSPYLSVYSEAEVRQILRLMGRPANDRVTRDIGREICIREGLKALLAATIAPEDSGYRITLEAVNARTGDAFVHEEAKAARKPDVLPAVHQASVRVRKKLGESMASIEKFSMPLPAATTSSLEALQLFALGDEKRFAGEEIGAITYYRRATELDPNFATAYARLGVLYYNIGDQANSEKSLQKAFELRDRTNEHERLYITAHYYADSGQLSKGLAAYELYKQTYPKEPTPYNNLAVIYQEFGQYENALSNAQQAVQLGRGSTLLYDTLIASFAGLNQMEEARAAARTALQANPNASGPHVELATFAWTEKRLGEMERELERAEATPDGQLKVSSFRTGLALWRGQLKEARALSAQGYRRAMDMNLPAAAAEIVAGEAVNEAVFGNRAQALERARAALKLSPSLLVRQNVAVALAVVGENERALGLVQQMGKERPYDTKVQFVILPLVRALVETNQNHAGKAIDELDGAMVYARANPAILYARGLAYLKLKRSTDAAEMFQRILDLRAETGPDFTVALAQLGIAQAYAQQGAPGPSRVAYQTFLALWENADNDLPQLKLARQEYARLQG